MGRRDDEQLPPVEVVGVGSEITSVQHVSTGAPGGPRRRGLGLLIAIAVVGLLVAGAMLGDDDEAPIAGEREEETTSSTRRSTTTTRPRRTTTTTAPPAAAPLFASHDVRGWLLSGGQGGWTLFDIASGQEQESGYLSFDNPYSTRVVTGGLVMVIAGRARHYDLRLPTEEQQPVDLGAADQLIDAVEADEIWLIDGTRATLVDLEGRELRSFLVPAGVFDPAMAPTNPAAATTQGLLFGRAGRIYLVNQAGVDAVAVGELVGATRSSMLVYSCGEDAAECGIDLRSLSGELIRPLDAEQASADFGWGVSSAADGRFALLTHPPSPTGDASVITLHQPDGTAYARIDVPAWMAFPPGWLPGDAGLIGARNGLIVWIHETSDGWVLDTVAGLSRVQSEGVLVISPE